MRDLVEGGMRIILSFLKLLLLDHFLFQLGRIGLLMITLGSYPKPSQFETHRNRIQLAGVLLLVVVWVAIVVFNHWRRSLAGWPA